MYRCVHSHHWLHVDRYLGSTRTGDGSLWCHDFGERLTPRLMLGILMILVAVTFIVVGKPLMTFLKEEVAGGMKRKLTR